MKHNRILLQSALALSLVGAYAVANGQVKADEVDSPVINLVDIPGAVDATKERSDDPEHVRAQFDNVDTEQGTGDLYVFVNNKDDDFSQRGQSATLEIDVFDGTFSGDQKVYKSDQPLAAGETFDPSDARYQDISATYGPGSLEGATTTQLPLPDFPTSYVVKVGVKAKSDPSKQTVTGQGSVIFDGDNKKKVSAFTVVPFKQGSDASKDESEQPTEDPEVAEARTELENQIQYYQDTVDYITDTALKGQNTFKGRIGAIGKDGKREQSGSDRENIKQAQAVLDKDDASADELNEAAQTAKANAEKLAGDVYNTVKGNFKKGQLLKDLEAAIAQSDNEQLKASATQALETGRKEYAKKGGKAKTLDELKALTEARDAVNAVTEQLQNPDTAPTPNEGGDNADNGQGESQTDQSNGEDDNEQPQKDGDNAEQPEEDPEVAAAREALDQEIKSSNETADYAEEIYPDLLGSRIKRAREEFIPAAEAVRDKKDASEEELTKATATAHDHNRSLVREIWGALHRDINVDALENQIKKAEAKYSQELADEIATAKTRLAEVNFQYDRFENDVEELDEAKRLKAVEGKVEQTLNDIKAAFKRVDESEAGKAKTPQAILQPSTDQLSALIKEVQESEYSDALTGKQSFTNATKGLELSNKLLKGRASVKKATDRAKKNLESYEILKNEFHIVKRANETLTETDQKITQLDQALAAKDGDKEVKDALAEKLADARTKFDKTKRLAQDGQIKPGFEKPALTDLLRILPDIYAVENGIAALDYQYPRASVEDLAKAALGNKSEEAPQPGYELTLPDDETLDKAAKLNAQLHKDYRDAEKLAEFNRNKQAYADFERALAEAAEEHDIIIAEQIRDDEEAKLASKEGLKHLAEGQKKQHEALDFLDKLVEAEKEHEQIEKDNADIDLENAGIVSALEQHKDLVDQAAFDEKLADAKTEHEAIVKDELQQAIAKLADTIDYLKALGTQFEDDDYANDVKAGQQALDNGQDLDEIKQYTKLLNDDIDVLESLVDNGEAIAKQRIERLINAFDEAETQGALKRIEANANQNSVELQDILDAEQFEQQLDEARAEHEQIEQDNAVLAQADHDTLTENIKDAVQSAADYNKESADNAKFEQAIADAKREHEQIVADNANLEAEAPKQTFETENHAAHTAHQGYAVDAALDRIEQIKADYETSIKDRVQALIARGQALGIDTTALEQARDAFESALGAFDEIN